MSAENEELKEILEEIKTGGSSEEEYSEDEELLEEDSPEESEQEESEDGEELDNSDAFEEGLLEESEELEEDISEEAQDSEPIETRLERIQKDFIDKEVEKEEKTLEQKIKEYEENLQRTELNLQQESIQLQQKINDIFPVSSAFSLEDGRHVFEATPQELNDHLTKLHDSGKPELAYKVSEALSAFNKQAPELRKAKEELEGRVAQVQTEVKSFPELKTNYLEWNEVESVVKKDLPELTPEMLEKLGKAVQTRAHNDGKYVAQLVGVGGKMKALLEMAREMGILNMVSENRNKVEVKREEPLAPDAKRRSKKVKPKKRVTFTRELIGKMSQEQFLEHEKEIDRALAQGLIQ